MNRTVIGIVSLLFVVSLISGGVLFIESNCGTLAQWGLSVGPSNTTVAKNGSFVFHGVVGMSGSTGQPYIQDVRIVFFAANGTRLATLPVGDFGTNAQRYKNISVVLDRRPTRIVPRAERIRDPSDANWGLAGVRWNGEEYEAVTVRTDPEPWYC